MPALRESPYQCNCQILSVLYLIYGAVLYPAVTQMAQASEMMLHAAVLPAPWMSCQG